MTIGIAKIVREGPTMSELGTQVAPSVVEGNFLTQVARAEIAPSGENVLKTIHFANIFLCQELPQVTDCASHVTGTRKEKHVWMLHPAVGGPRRCKVRIAQNTHACNAFREDIQK
jgi:hypothetical protein